MYYQETFLDEQLAAYLRSTRDLDYIALINPDDFVRWIFPRLYSGPVSRAMKHIAARYGYTVAS